MAVVRNEARKRLAMKRKNNIAKMERRDGQINRSRQKRSSIYSAINVVVVVVVVVVVFVVVGEMNVGFDAHKKALSTFLTKPLSAQTFSFFSAFFPKRRNGNS